MYYTKQEEIDAKNKKLVILGAVIVIGMMLFLIFSSYFNQEETEELSLENLHTSGSSENSTNKETLEIRNIDGNKEIIINGLIVSEEEYQEWLNDN